MSNALALALSAEGMKPPCGAGKDKCRHWQTCSENKMACNQFEYWVHSGVFSNMFQRVPTKAIFERIRLSDD